MFDSLVHVTKDGSWLGGNRYDASVERLLREMDLAGVTRACIVGIASFVDNETTLRTATAHPDRFVPIAGIDPSKFACENALKATLRQVKEMGFRGIKLHPRLNEYNPMAARCGETISHAGALGLVVFLDTLFRQRNRAVPNPIDIIDVLVHRCRNARLVLLHSAGPAMLELFELGRMHENIRLDLSFSIMRYAGSSLDSDMRFLIENLDQRVVIGSDFPEYTPCQALQRFELLADQIPIEKRNAVLNTNLASWFTD